MALHKTEHRGMNFTIEPIGEAEWRWRFHPKGEPNAASDARFTGTAWGSDESAEAACKSAIDQWLDHRRTG
jgi:hypothetical protein